MNATPAVGNPQLGLAKDVPPERRDVYAPSGESCVCPNCDSPHPVLRKIGRLQECPSCHGLYWAECPCRAARDRGEAPKEEPGLLARIGKIVLGSLVLAALALAPAAARADGTARIAVSNALPWPPGTPSAGLDKAFGKTMLDAEYSVDGGEWQDVSATYAGERRVTIVADCAPGLHAVAVRARHPVTGQLFSLGPLRKRIRDGRQTTWDFTARDRGKGRLVWTESDFGDLRVRVVNHKAVAVAPTLWIDGKPRKLRAVRAKGSATVVIGPVPAGWRTIDVAFRDARRGRISSGPTAKYVRGGRVTPSEVTIVDPLI